LVPRMTQCEINEQTHNVENIKVGNERDSMPGGVL
jgi:hypothetical protein